MHSHIGIFAYAKTAEEARQKILAVVKEQTGEQRHKLWDYFVFDKENTGWELLEKVSPAENCTDLINQLQKSTDEMYEYHKKKLEAVVIKDNKDEIITWSYLLSSDKAFHLFDDNGETIRDRRTLDNTLDKYKCLYEDKGKINPYKDDKVFIKDFDVHF